MKRKCIPALVCCCLLAAGCATNQGPNEQAGMIIGGIMGGLIGQGVGEGRGQTAATIVGTLIGTSIGGAIGRSMDDTDRLKVGHSLETVRTGVPSTWRNPDTQSQYTVTPTRTYEQSGGPCREYSLEAVIGGENEQLYGTACRQPDGSWKIVN
ncbi:hypothetical protein FKG94_13975 [Exilibacterium tricleocarpae]|uniref:Surface antigen domain-containing protein n=1 Tax=Exilibacterium tricleocarpae TaxID=2591008 RepID=A0A545TLV8_9GAMM|nr:RT0821/Lpp0805 family surface protein [Exilibacterium tricleocarpae]TQV78174.1 hypothetical protein FKG94_13975 [Exilibacterium tricleocarpae]